MSLRPFLLQNEIQPCSNFDLPGAKELQTDSLGSCLVPMTVESFYSNEFDMAVLLCIS
jgi:hypothetical protein